MAVPSLDALSQAPPEPTDTWFLAPDDFSRPDVMPSMAAPSDVYGWLSFGSPALTTEWVDADAWSAETQAGRAQVAALAAWDLTHPAESRRQPACAEALKLIDRAQELGDVRAAYLRGMYYAGDCGKTSRAQAIEPLRVAAELGNAAAASVLSDLHSNGPRELRDPVHAYVYGAFAAQRIDGSAQTWPDWIKKPRPVPLSRLKAADRQRATDLLNELLAKDRAFREQRAKSLEARNSIIVASQVKAPGWSYVARRLDASGECFDNVVGNCRGAPRWIRVAIRNTNSIHQQCQVRVKSRPFVGKDAIDKQRTAWVAPGATRDLSLGLAQGEVLPEDVVVSCAPIEVGAATKQAQTCRAKYIGELRADEFYPPRLERLGIEGVVTLRVLALARGKLATDVEVVKSSGNNEIDQAAVNAARSVPFDAACKYGIAMLKLSFKIQ